MSGAFIVVSPIVESIFDTGAPPNITILNIRVKSSKQKFLNIKDNDLVPENTPHSIAAGIVYYVSQMCNLNISKKNVNNVSEISEVTINKCFKKLEQLNMELIPKKIIAKYTNN